MFLLPSKLLSSLKPKWYFEDTDQVRVISLQCLPAALRRKTTPFKLIPTVMCESAPPVSPATSPTNFPFAPYTKPHLYSFSSFPDAKLFSNSEPFCLRFPLPVMLYFSARLPLSNSLHLFFRKQLKAFSVQAIKSGLPTLSTTVFFL